MEHTARHGVNKHDVLALLNKRDYYLRRSGELYVIIGRTDGKILFLVVARSRKRQGLYHVVTCRAAQASEKNLWKRRRKET